MNNKTKYKIAKLANNYWVKAFGYLPQDSAEEEKGEFYSLISIKSEADVEVSQIGEVLIDYIQDAYYSRKEETYFKAFENSIKSVKSKLEELISDNPELQESGVEISLAIMVARGNSAYLALIGEMQILIIRGGELVNISDALQDSNFTDFLYTGSFDLEKDDLIILTGNNDANKIKVEEMLNLDLSELKLDTGLIVVGYQYEIEDNKADLVSNVNETKNIPVEIAEVELLDNLQDKPQAEPKDQVKDGLEYEYKNNEEYSNTSSEEQNNNGYYPQSEIEKIDKEPGIFKKIYSRLKLITSKLYNKLVDILSTISANISSLFTRIIHIYRERKASTETNLRNEVDDVSQLTDNRTPVKQRRRGNNSMAGEAISNLGSTLDKYRVTLLRGIRRRNLDSINNTYLIAFGIGIIGALFFIVRGVALEAQFNASVEEYKATLTPITQQISAIESDAQQVGVNNAQAEDRQLVINRIINTKAQVAAKKKSEFAITEVQEQLSSMESRLDTALLSAKLISTKEADLVVDIGASFQGAEPTDLVLANSKLYIVDSDLGYLYSSSININSQAAIVLEDLNNPRLINTDSENNLIVIDQNPDSAMLVYNPTEDSSRRIPSLTPDRMNGINAFQVWTNNKNLYGVNSTRKTITRQADLSGNYQQPDYNNPWRLDDNFSLARDIYVDGSVYVLINGKGIQRYFGGEPAGLTIEGMLQDELALYNSSIAFEISNSKIVTVTENGDVFIFNRDSADASKFFFDSRIELNTNLSDVKDMYFDDKENIVYLLEGARILSFSI